MMTTKKTMITEIDLYELTEEQFSHALRTDWGGLPEAGAS